MYRGPSDFSFIMYVIITNSMPLPSFLRELKMATTLTIILFPACLNINALFCFCLAGFTWRRSHNSLKGTTLQLPNRLKKNNSRFSVCLSWETCGLLWLVLHLSGFWRKCRKWWGGKWGQKLFTSRCGLTHLCTVTLLIKGDGRQKAEDKEEKVWLRTAFSHLPHWKTTAC